MRDIYDDQEWGVILLRRLDADALPLGRVVGVAVQAHEDLELRRRVCGGWQEAHELVGLGSLLVSVDDHAIGWIRFRKPGEFLEEAGRGLVEVVIEESPLG